jgi:putative sigma-54 modulation protein
VDVSVSSRKIELTPALREAVEEKIGRMARFLDGMDRAEVHFFEERNPRIASKDVCEVTMEGHGHHVRVRAAAADPFAAVDVAVAKLEQQLHKLKTKLVSRHHPRTAKAAGIDGVEGIGDVDGTEDLVDPSRIVRSKQFTMKPMTPDEAVLQMDLLGHDFFFFSNAETSRAGVVYRRRSGDVGLIDEAS